jgi:serine/threonine-protein kinase SRPK3
VHLGDSFKNDRYRVLHKLGAGGFSTVWLASDSVQRRSVSLKILKAEASDPGNELKALQHLIESPLSHPGRSYVASILDHFTITGPNGVHTCLVSSFAGPSIYQICQSPGEVAGNNRLRGELARIYARQVTDAVGFLHSVGIVHGGKKNSFAILQDMLLKLSYRCYDLEYSHTACRCGLLDRKRDLQSNRIPRQRKGHYVIPI